MRSHADRVRRALRGAAFAALSVLAVAACDDEIAPPFEVEGVGRISGLLYFDSDRNGAFEPAAGDSALADVPIHLRERDTDDVIPGSETTTDASGRFTITNVPAGTHDLVISEGALEGATVCQNPRPVSVAIGAVASPTIAAEPACILDIAAAEALPQGTFIIVRGIVSVAPDQLRDAPTVAYVQDETGGIALSNLPDGSAQVGDLIQVAGTLGSFGSELQINSPVIEELVPDVGDPEPEVITVAQLAAQGADAKHELQGTLVRVEGVLLADAFGSGGLNGQNAPITQAGAGAQIRVEANVIPPDDLGTFFTVGACYDITGAAGQFNGDPQIKPRTTDDIEEVTCP